MVRQIRRVGRSSRVLVQMQSRSLLTRRSPPLRNAPQLRQRRNTRNIPTVSVHLCSWQGLAVVCSAFRKVLSVENYILVLCKCLSEPSWFSEGKKKLESEPLSCAKVKVGTSGQVEKTPRTLNEGTGWPWSPISRHST